jgi:hypothetical protein
MVWCLYYDDGSTFSDEDGPWTQAPADGVLFAVEWEGDQKRVYSGHDYYLNDGGLGYTDDLGPLLRKLGVVKFGRWTSHANLERVRKRMEAD